MKKLSLLLFAFCASVMSWANESDPYRLNPFAYDLSSSWDEASQKLTLRFKVNSVPNLEDVNGWSCGIQVYAVDSRETKYYIWGTPGNTIRNAHNGGAGTYEYVADLSSGLDLHGKLIPRNEDLTWMVRVAGRGNESSTAVSPGNNEPKIDYTLPRFWNYVNNFSDKRYISPSIAVSTNPNAPNFGDIFIIDNMDPSTHTNSRWTAKNTGRGIYVYKPDFKTKAYSGNKVAINTGNKDGGFADSDEPRDICVSKNGRVFVCSYSTASASTVAVWEVKNNYTTWTSILSKEEITRKVTGGTTNTHSVVSMDVKGEGDDITLLLLCKGSTNNNNNKNFPLLKCVEYNVKTKTLTEIQLPQQIYDFVYYNDGINRHARIAYDDTSNWIWCGFGTNGGASYVRAFDPTIANDNNNVNKNLKINESFGDFWGGEAFYVKGNMLVKSIRFSNYDRPSIIFRTIDRSKTDVGDVITNDPCFTYTGDVGNSSLDADIIAACYNDFALDYANNLYVANNWSGQVFPISLPYSGSSETPAPSNQKFKLKASYPNILATDLKYEPVGTTDKYIFSFITNTKPTNAEIRFYKKENIGTMNSNIATIHADTYNKGKDATTPPDYVYTFSPEDCKQGLMSATFKMVGGDVNSKVVIDALPPGEMYWSVYVETEKSTCFAPIYRSASYSTGTFHPLHATVNNYPETDMFGSLFVANNSDWSTDERRTNGLLVYGLNPSGNANEFKLDDRERYAMRANYLNERITSGFLNYPRRMAVAPDGKVYIADEGASPKERLYNQVVVFSNGGIKVWDPKQPTTISTFTGGQINTASGVAFWGDPTNKDSWKIYYSNTYDEFSKHNSSNNYTEEEQDDPDKYGWNGLVVHQIGNSTPLKELALGMGDASGNISVVAMEKGVWLCQYREHTVAIKEKIIESYADNMGAYLLSFVPYEADSRSTTSTYNPRTWTSCTTHGITWSGTYPNFKPKEFEKSWWSQTQSSPLQSTPGGGLAYRKIKGEEFLLVVNHDGNIVKIKIDGWTGSGKSVKPTMTAENDRVEILQTPGYTKCTKQAKKDIIQNGKVVYTYGPYDWTTSYINSMEFDYAGNLVTVTGSAASHSGATHEIIIYTMPYDRTNAQEIRAPESCIYIPERLHQMAMEEVDIQGVLNRHNIDGACAVDLYRPLQGGMFNTICLPFVLEMDHLNNPLAGSEVRQFTGATIESIGGENILCLKFTEVSTIQCNIPYIIKPQQNIKQIMRFNWPVTLAKSTEVKTDPKTFDTDNKITYQGILPKTDVEALYDPNTNLPLRLILVADNRLAVLTGNGEMYGFRGYFDLAKPLPPGTVAKISAKKDTPTNTTIVVDGKKVNIDKYLREGRVYIRVGDSLYTVDGQLVK